MEKPVQESVSYPGQIDLQYDLINNNLEWISWIFFGTRQLSMQIIASEYPKAMDSNVLDRRLSKRQALIQSYRKQLLYIRYKAEKSSDQPDTPLASDYHSKRGWERAVFEWKNAMKTVFWQ